MRENDGRRFLLSMQPLHIMKKPSKKLEGQVALVAGGAKNLGGLISRLLADEGAKVVVHYNSEATQNDAEATVAAIVSAGGEAFAIRGDFRRADKVAFVFAETRRRYGRVDIAINTIGKVLKKPILDVTDEEWDEMSAVNAKAAFYFIREAGLNLEDRGRIVSIVTSLLAAYTSLYSTYAGSKAPVEHYTRAASKEFGSRGISVVAVGPGPMDTPFFYGQESLEAVEYHSTAAALSAYSTHGLTDIADIAPLVLFLVTEGRWITGQTIFSNGGYTTR